MTPIRVHVFWHLLIHLYYTCFILLRKITTPSTYMHRSVRRKTVAKAAKNLKLILLNMILNVTKTFCP
jgi:hypothetical protein